MTTGIPPVKGAQTSIPDEDNAVYEGHINDGAVTLRKTGELLGELYTPTAILAYRFIDDDASQAEAGDADVLGAAPSAMAAGMPLKVISSGFALLQADTALVKGDEIKVGSEGRATKLNTGAVELDATVAGVASSFTQPGAATALEILQAADVVADRGRGITIVGTDASDDPIEETIFLSSVNTTTVVPGTTEFKTVVGAYTADGAVLGAQNVTIREIDNTGVTTLPGAAASVGRSTPTTIEAFNQAISFVGPNTDATYVIVLGYKTLAPDVLAFELYTFDGESPSVATSATRWRQVTQVFVGAFTNAANATLNLVADSFTLKAGVAASDQATRDGLVVVAMMPSSQQGLPYRSLLNDAQSGTFPAGSVTGADLATGIVRVTLAAGVDETDPLPIPVTGMAEGDEVVAVLVFTTAADIATLAAHAGVFTAAVDGITPGTEVDNTGNQYFVVWIDKTP